MAKSDERFSDKVLDDGVLNDRVLDNDRRLDDGVVEEGALEDGAFADSSPDESVLAENPLDARSPDAPSTQSTESAESAAGGSRDPFDSPAVLRQIFATGSREEQAKALGRLLSFAPWDDIWSHIDRRRARELFADVELPDSLQAAWARYLGIEDGDS